MATGSGARQRSGAPWSWAGAGAVLLAALAGARAAGPPGEAGAESSGAGWPLVRPAVAAGGGERYQALLQPALQAVRLTYTATFGTYRREQEVNRTLGDGWERLYALEADPPEGGMRALVFLHAASRRGLVAFRGTDLNRTGASGQADFCAGRLLWENASRATLPGFCAAFTDSQLDYLANARALAQRAAGAMPEGTDLLLTGHSLGAGLAALVAGGWRHRRHGATGPEERHESWLFSEAVPQVFGLSAPAFNDALRRREHVDPASLPADRSVLIYNQFDPIGVEARDRGGLVGATVCTFAPPEPEACVECYSRRPFGGAACDRCFEQTHILSLYLKDLNGTATARPYEPLCPQLADLQFADLLA